MNMNQFDLPERRKALIEQYWMLLIVMDNAINFDRPEIAQAVSDELVYISSALEDLGIDPDDWDMDILLTPARWDEEDRQFPEQADTSAFNEFVAGLDIDGGES